MAKLSVRAGRIGLPYPGSPQSLFWVLESEIRHVESLNAGCVITFGSPMRSLETSDGKLLHFYHQTVEATVDEVLDACEQVRSESTS